MARCPVCRHYYGPKKMVLTHMEGMHGRNIPANMSTGKFYYALYHDGKTTGICTICGNPTKYDETTGRTKILCENIKCKQVFSERAQQNSLKVLGVRHSTQLHEYQMKMLANRKISGEYAWSDGKATIQYVGSYEHRFLQFLDNFLDFDPLTIHAPCPLVFYYEYDGEIHEHTPDFYIDILDLIVEIKHGGDNPNNHPKIQAVDVQKDIAKEKAIHNSSHNYIKIVNNDFGPFIQLLAKLTDERQSDIKNRHFIINESSAEIETTGTVRYMLDTRDIYFIVYGTIDELNVAVSFTKDAKDVIIYDNNKFRLMTDDEKHKLLDFDSYEIVSIYKYHGNYSLQSNTSKLVDMAYSGDMFESVSSLTAFATIFSPIFDEYTTHTIMDYITNPYLIKLSTQSEYYKIGDNLFIESVSSILYSASTKDKESLGPRNFYNTSKFRYIHKIDGEEVAFVEVKTRYAHAFINIFVTDEYRGKGISNILVQKAMEYCKKNQAIKTVVWTTNKNNEASIYLAKKYGFVETKSDMVGKNKIRFQLSIPRTAETKTERFYRILKEDLNTPEPLLELSISSDIDPRFEKSNSIIDPAKLTLTQLTKDVIDKYKNEVSSLIHLRVSNDYIGYLYFYEKTPVAYINVDKVVHTIQAMEVLPKFKGIGLSKRLLDDAVHHLHADNLSVNKSNELAISIYEKYGFKEYDSTKTMLFMKLSSSKIDKLSSEWVYFALTDSEVKAGKVEYKNIRMSRKGVNLTLDGLKRFVNDFKIGTHVHYYTKVPLSVFKVDHTVLPDRKYDMIHVEIPFEFKIDKAYKLDNILTEASITETELRKQFSSLLNKKNILILGENHGNTEEWKSYQDLIKQFKPEFLLHELLYSDVALDKSTILDRLSKCNKEHLCETFNKHIYQFAYDNDIKLIGIDLENIPNSNTLSDKEKFEVREKHMLDMIEKYDNKRIVVIVGDTHLRNRISNQLGNVSPIYGYYKNNPNALILRSEFGEFK